MKEKLIYIIVVVMVLMFVSIDSYGAEALYNQILRNKPNISKSHAVRIAKITLKYADKFDVPANLFIAIMSVESNYVTNVTNGRTKDYGIAQVNEHNIRVYGFNKQKILHNLDYSIWAGIMVFKYFYRRYKHLGFKHVASTYNCGTRPKCVLLRSVRVYSYRVMKSL